MRSRIAETGWSDFAAAAMASVDAGPFSMCSMATAVIWSLFSGIGAAPWLVVFCVALAGFEPAHPNRKGEVRSGALPVELQRRVTPHERGVAVRQRLLRSGCSAVPRSEGRRVGR